MIFTYFIGSIKIESDSINQLKDLSTEIVVIANMGGYNLSKDLSDLCFSIDSNYQSFYSLNQDNYDIVHQSI